MIKKGIISGKTGDLYLWPWTASPPSPCSPCQRRPVKVDFEAKAIRREPLRPGDSVAVYLADQSGSTGLVLGLWGEGEPWIS